ncbi:hypothetical protein [Lysobacter enzymogenes]|uniref:hypothetical protein n=1 Tax=Lysobacter enzymogenes TaxID=69 RepID=UPI000899B78F|nr:hypothetical protein [Lysobacter enzymogenes]SDW70332.1 hypothetical protein SAMN05421681_102595 [Lysobacter enzymogenes]
MTGYVLDCCTLLNLYCGWDGLRELADFAESFHVGKAVEGEVLYAFEFQPNGTQVRKSLSMSDLRKEYPLGRLEMTSQEEMDQMVRLAERLGDGEAEGIALATSRQMTFCSDDKPVAEAIRAGGLSVQLISTPELLQLWTSGRPDRLERMPAIVHRITLLGHFMPRSSSPHAAWWRAQLDKRKA